MQNNQKKKNCRLFQICQRNYNFDNQLRRIAMKNFGCSVTENKWWLANTLVKGNRSRQNQVCKKTFCRNQYRVCGIWPCVLLWRSLGGCEVILYMCWLFNFTYRDNFLLKCSPAGPSGSAGLCVCSCICFWEWLFVFLKPRYQACIFFYWSAVLER